MDDRLHADVTLGLTSLWNTNTRQVYCPFENVSLIKSFLRSLHFKSSEKFQIVGNNSLKYFADSTLLNKNSCIVYVSVEKKVNNLTVILQFDFEEYFS